MKQEIMVSSGWKIGNQYGTITLGVIGLPGIGIPSILTGSNQKLNGQEIFDKSILF